MLLEPAEKQTAEWFLLHYSGTVKREGRKLFQNGDLGPVSLVRNGQTLPIRSKEEADSSISPETKLILKGDHWDVDCGCGRYRCAHSYAAFLALFKSSATPSKKGSVREGFQPYADPFRASLEEALSRPLKGPEILLLTTLNTLSQKLRHGKQLTYQDYTGLLGGYWNFPDLSAFHGQREIDPRALWQQIARHCALRGMQVPSFMKSVTDWDAINREKAEIERQEEIVRWNAAMSGFKASGPAASTREVDLAIVVGGHYLQLAAKSEGAGEFKLLKPRQWDSLRVEIGDGSAIIPAAAMPIVNAFSVGDSYHRPSFAMSDLETHRLLSRLFRIPDLQSRLLTNDLQPFTRSAKHLEWLLSEPATGDYQLALQFTDGTHCPTIRCFLPGSPYLYLTDHSVLEGPYIPRNFGHGPHRIPAPALETPDGVAMLHALRVPLPERLASRVRKVRLGVVIKCALEPNHNDQEYCWVEFLAASEETGVTDKYTVAGWSEQKPSRQNADCFYDLDREALSAVPRLVESLGLTWDNFEQCWRIKANKNFPEKFLEWCPQIPRDCSLELDSELASLLKDPVKARVQLECQEVGVDWFDLKTTVNIDDTTLTPEEIQLLLKARGKSVRLAGKGWRRMEYQFTEEEDQCLAKLGLSPHDFSPEPQRLHALQLADRAAEKMLAAEQFRRIQERARELKARVTPPLPATITATLRPYQTDGFHFLAYLSENRFGGILADDMGLGKTVQTLSWLEWLRNGNSDRKPSLVVCPKSVMDNWRNEATKFAPEMRVASWNGAEADRFPEIARDHDLLVMNYAQLRALAQTAAGIEWNSIILDEAQYIKNPDSQTAQAARGLTGSYRLALSGTPIENRLLDLWSLMAYAMPGILGNRADFKRRFDSASDPFARKRLAARVRPFLLRRTKSQVATELPDRIEEDIVCEMEGVQQKLYRAEFKRAQQLLLNVKTPKELNEFRFNFLTSLLRLRQICCHPALVDAAQKKQESAKLNALTDLLEPILEEGHKVLVFSQFVEMLQLIRARLKANKWRHHYLDGSSENRGDLVKNFQDDPGAAVFLISLKAGGFGLNLTAASYVVLYDPWWNPAVENQAIDRTHRIGQTQKVIAYRLLTKNSIEQKIRALQKQKSALADNVLGDEAFSASLTLDDLKYLFQDDPSE